jgi:hypothetical protein
MVLVFMVFGACVAFASIIWDWLSPLQQMIRPSVIRAPRSMWRETVYFAGSGAFALLAFLGIGALRYPPVAKSLEVAAAHLLVLTEFSQDQTCASA